MATTITDTQFSPAELAAIAAAVRDIAPAVDDICGLREGLNPTTIVAAVKEGMLLAGLVSGLNGAQKKEVVVRVLRLCIDRSDAAGPFEGVVLALVPQLCDALIEVNNGELRFNQRTRARVTGCFSCLSAKAGAKAGR